MSSAITASVLAIMNEEQSFYQYADAIVRLTTRENIFDVMASLPEPFRTKFIGFAKEVYVPTSGKRFVIGRPLPDESIEAIRSWFATQR